MRRLSLPVLGIVALLVLAAAAVAASTAGRPAPRPQPEPVPAKAASPGEVVDLSAAAEERAPAQNRRPSENVTDAELASIEQKIKERSRGGAAPDDGVAPGAPSDEEVRDAIRQMRSGGGDDADPVRRGKGGLIYPINGQLTSPFGMRWGRLHAGIDLAAPNGRPIRAAASGRVILAAVTGGYGLYTCIDHGSSISTCYAHQSRFGTRQGERVREGDVIGYVGNTGNSFGNHLHFEVRVSGRPVNPMDYL